MAPRTSLYDLPNELLTQIAGCLEEARVPRKMDLVRLVRVSKRMQPIAEDVLYRSANVSAGAKVSCSHNDMLELLRTLLRHPDLGSKIRILNMSTVRRNRARKYEKEGSLNLRELREMSLEKLKELGYGVGCAWYTMVEASIESAFAGLVLALLPKVVDLKLSVLDHARGDPCPEPLLALFGTANLPAKLAPTFRTCKRLSILADHFPMLSEDFANLTCLALGHVSIRDILRLNGPYSLRGVSGVKRLYMKLVVQVAETFIIENLDAKFEDLLAAMGFPALTHLTVEFFNEGCRCPEGHTLEIKTFLKDLRSVSSTLEKLELCFDDLEDVDDEQWILKNSEPAETFKQFTALRHLSIPERFLLDSANDDRTITDILPASLEKLDLIAPKPEILRLLQRIADNRSQMPTLGKVFLRCREYNAPAHDLWYTDTPVWEQLDSHGITTVVLSLDTGTEKTMPFDPSEGESEEDDDDEAEIESDDDDDDEADDDDDDDSLPDLESVTGDNEIDWVSEANEDGDYGHDLDADEDSNDHYFPPDESF
ncbi:hypothetical protein K504DRAFT_460279 [Pleomassaria siparia CBS 279.74]|uniref:F-box domain-containing protein n=1 Tax=Pleomassaria siparia CBS 279.74 TaxID=1314801 RepID=A0A6G1JYY0_9PLEO|nr:hypothetical protein K504DRAFT_460279 [Pleomassaria siparia CBS 279.74]